MLTKAAIEPVIPTNRLVGLEDLACTILEAAARLSAKVKEPSRADVAELTRWMHCYYSNLIEGQQTRVRDIEAALKRDFATEPEKRNLQKLALAHLSVQRWAAGFSGPPHSREFICELHRRFYSELPLEMRVATTASGEKNPFEPGELRAQDVQVGDHVGPPPELVPGLLKHFSWRYENLDGSRLHKIIAMAASHHRLAWIHPFRDGNGRVVRLYSDTVIHQLGIDGGGFWSLSRGLAYHRNEYYERLANADQERSGSSAADGRGQLSERMLWEFCEFILRVMRDQIAFMERTLDLDGLLGRIERFVSFHPAFKDDHERVFLLLREALGRGEFQRGEAGKIIGARERTGRGILAKVVDAGLLKSDSPKTPVRLAFPSSVLETYFPTLFPPGQLIGP